MEAANSNTKILFLEVSECELYEIKNEEQRLLEKGSLQLYENLENKLPFLALNDFKYRLSKEITIISFGKHSESHLYVFPNKDSFFGIHLATAWHQEKISKFEEILKEKANLIFSDDGNTTPGKKQEELIAKVDFVNENNSAKATNYLHLVGDVTKKGLVSTGKIGGTLIGKFGKFLLNKINKNTEEMVISEETKQKVHRVNECSKTVFTFTKTQIDAMIGICKKIGIEGKIMLEKTETGKKIMSEENYKEAKEIGKASAQALGVAFEGMVEALSSMGKSTGIAVTEIVAHKYGEEAEAVAKDSFEAVRNIGIVFCPNVGA